jgi:hypothetical protein
MDLPECDKLKIKYDDCYTSWKTTKVTDMQVGGLHLCTQVFEDYRDCAVEGMKARVALAKKKREDERTQTKK